MTANAGTDACLAQEFPNYILLRLPSKLVRVPRSIHTRTHTQSKEDRTTGRLSGRKQNIGLNKTERVFSKFAALRGVRVKDNLCPNMDVRLSHTAATKVAQLRSLNAE